MIIVYANRNRNHTIILFHSLRPLIPQTDDLSPLSQTLIHKLRERGREAQCLWTDQKVCILGSPHGTHWPCVFSTVLYGLVF